MTRTRVKIVDYIGADEYGKIHADLPWVKLVSENSWGNGEDT